MSDERACQSCVPRAQNACFLEGRATDGRPLLKFSPLVNGSIAAGRGAGARKRFDRAIPPFPYWPKGQGLRRGAWVEEGD